MARQGTPIKWHRDDCLAEIVCSMFLDRKGRPVLQGLEVHILNSGVKVYQGGEYRDIYWVKAEIERLEFQAK